MDFSQVNDSKDFVLMPEGTVVEAVVNKIEVKPGKSDPSKAILHIEYQVAKGEYMYEKISDFITVAGGDAEMPERNRSKVKRMLEYGKDASASNMGGYIISETTGGDGRSQTKWSELFGMTVGFQVKIDSFTSNTDGKLLYSNKISAYASKNKDSGGYKFHEAIASERQPWQKPLPDLSNPQKSSSQPAGMDDFASPPVDSYNQDNFG